MHKLRKFYTATAMRHKSRPSYKFVQGELAGLEGYIEDLSDNAQVVLDG